MRPRHKENSGKKLSKSGHRKIETIIARGWRPGDRVADFLRGIRVASRVYSEGGGM